MKNNNSDPLIPALLLPLLALIAPFIIWPIEILLPYPYIIEELLKAFLVLYALKIPQRSLQLKIVIITALLFSFSESVFYLANIFAVGNLNTFFQRLLLTTPMHVLTTLIIFIVASKNIKLIPLGVILGGIIHYIFNNILIPLF